MSGGARIAGDASEARRSSSLQCRGGARIGSSRDRASCDGRLTPEKTLNFGTAPAQPRLNFESRERCSATKERGREEMANRRHERKTSQAAQENRRGPDTIGQAAQAAAALGEQAARASGNAARMAAGASEHAARAGADLFESTAGAVEQLWHSGRWDCPMKKRRKRRSGHRAISMQLCSPAGLMRTPFKGYLTN
jgi:hypothetical protein